MSAIDTDSRTELAWLIHRACGCHKECPPDTEDFTSADAIVAAGFVRPDFATSLTLDGLAQMSADVVRAAVEAVCARHERWPIDDEYVGLVPIEQIREAMRSPG